MVIVHTYVDLPEGIFGVPSGKRFQKTMEHHHLEWVNQLFGLGHFQ